MLDHRRVIIKCLVGVQLRAPGAGHALHREQILGRIGNSVERPAIVPALNFFFRGLRLGHGNFRRQPRVGIEARPQLFAALQKILSEFDRRKFFRLDALGEFGDGQETQFFRGHGVSSGLLWRVGSFPDASILEWILLALFFSRSTSGLR